MRADRIYRVETTPAINLNPSIPYRPPYFSLRSRPTVSVLPPSVILRREGRRGEEGGEEEVAGRFQEEKSQYGHWSIRFPPTLLRPVKYVTGSGGSGDIEDTQGRREGGKGERGGGARSRHGGGVLRGGGGGAWRRSKISSVDINRYTRLVDSPFHVDLLYRERRDLLLTRRSGDRCKSLVRRFLLPPFSSRGGTFYANRTVLSPF